MDSGQAVEIWTGLCPDNIQCRCLRLPMTFGSESSVALGVGVGCCARTRDVVSRLFKLNVNLTDLREVLFSVSCVIYSWSHRINSAHSLVTITDTDTSGVVPSLTCKYPLRERDLCNPVWKLTPRGEWPVATVITTLIYNNTKYSVRFMKL
jgi:hypothetical protein